MPGMDGFETATQIKEREKTRDIPIIFLTAISREPHHALRGYSTGAVDYLAKPYDPWILQAKVAVFIDLYEKNLQLKEKQELLALKATELERSNSDLQQFAYVASHDLQEPLRVIDGYLDLLRTSLSDGEKDAALDMIDRIGRSTGRMDALIHGLLDYARVDSKLDSFKPHDLNDVVKDALMNLGRAVKDNDVHIQVGELPVVEGDESQLGQLFQNLISNAIKFRRTDPPEVVISCNEVGDEREFTVADNGIGIEASYVEKIFTIFERLHSRDKYPGSGIGLSVCKKIVERHGGRIWAESTPGTGTTIHFTLPMK
jgi:light-regulated signal transduction histidine kinase (bacteriophytochrome)